MSANADAAAQVVNLACEMGGKAVEVSAKITGDMAKQILALLVAVMAQKNKTHGQMKISNLINQRGDVENIIIDADKYAAFKTYVKDFGILYAVAQDVNNQDKMVLFVAQKDAGRACDVLEKIGAHPVVVGHINDIKVEEKGNIEEAFNPTITWNDMKINAADIEGELSQNISLAADMEKSEEATVDYNNLFEDMAVDESAIEKPQSDVIYADMTALTDTLDKSTEENFTHGTSDVKTDIPSERKSESSKNTENLEESLMSEKNATSRYIDNTNENERPSVRGKMADIKKELDIAGNDKGIEESLDISQVISENDLKEIAN